ncbi:hypothetical protein CVT25_013727 [Psilocybe cyanescens]|uniref:RanBP2-type domain-containing protein n=1 Tax=Psilocybe cyanescens TaxID=93625 RepID=A0A409XL67_PSICY|nr:hypothetical protein CVT25_013727 [Psilocybe cyanescens]
MSAIRSSSNRAEARKKRSTPYARTVVNKVFRFLGFVPADEVQEMREQRLNEPSDTEIDASSELQNPPSENHRRIINDNITPSPRHPYANASRDPLTAASSFNVVQPDSVPAIISGPKLERSTSDQSMDVDNKPTQSFSFTYSVSGSSSFSPLPDLARNDTPTSSTKKKLDRNPNGIYRWEGGGSAKHPRPRNRYASPAFGASPTPSRVVMKDDAPLGSKPFSDNKRRKVDEGSQGSSSSSSSSNGLPFPLTASPSTPQTNGATAPVTPRTNGSPAKTSPLSSSSRLRTPAKPTAPVVPSPLRQAWSDPAVPSRDDAKTSSTSQAKQTKTANFMAELIKETTPPKRPDLSNPYQTASPVGKVGPPRRGNKRTRATGKATVPTKDQNGGNDKQKDAKKEKDLSEYSPQAIIEATLPKGSKRSRPPAHFENPTSSSNASSDQPPAQRESPVIVETRKQVYTVEEPDADEEDSPRKKSKPTLNGNGYPSSFRHKSPSPQVPEVTVEEISDVVMDSTPKEKEIETEIPKLVIPAQSNELPASASSPTSRSSFSGFKPSSIPKEPSKLRFSFQAEGTSAPPSPAPPASIPLPQSTPPSLPKSDFKFSPPSSNFEFKFKVDEKATSPKSQIEPLKPVVEGPSDLEAIKAKVRAMNPSSLPVFSITLSGTTILPNSDDHVNARNTVKSLPASSLPVFEFGLSKSTPFSFGFDAFKPKSTFLTAQKPSPPKLARPAFLGGNSGVTLPKMPASVFTFADSAKSAPPVQGFNFAAAGMKAPTVSKDTWICSLCGLSNPTLASKCETCDTPSPKGASAPAPTPAPVAAPPAAPVKGFDFAAAGMKLPTANKGTWTCSLCGLSSPDSASKCETCETPR